MNKGLSSSRNTEPVSKGEYQLGILGTMAGLQEATVRQENLFSWFSCKLEPWEGMSLCWESAVPILGISLQIYLF